MKYGLLEIAIVAGVVALAVGLAGVGMLGRGSADCAYLSQQLAAKQACLELTSCRITPNELARGMQQKEIMDKHCGRGLPT